MRTCTTGIGAQVTFHLDYRRSSNLVKYTLRLFIISGEFFVGTISGLESSTFDTGRFFFSHRTCTYRSRKWAWFQRYCQVPAFWEDLFFCMFTSASDFTFCKHNINNSFFSVLFFTFWLLFFFFFVFLIFPCIIQIRSKTIPLGLHHLIQLQTL